MTRRSPHRASQLWPGLTSAKAKKQGMFLGYKLYDQLRILARLATPAQVRPQFPQAVSKNRPQA